MQAIVSFYDRMVAFASSRFGEGIALLITRLALAGIFWRSYKTKVVEGTWLEIDEIQYFLFENEFAGLPLSPELAVPLSTYAEFFFPILLVIGLATRFSAMARMIMALGIQAFVFPTWDHWWGWAITVTALAAMLIVRGGGIFSLDALLASRRSK
jgi:putative oxidoreductase